MDKAVAPAALAETDSALYDTLSQCLDVTATRAVTYTEQIPFDTVTQENENQDQTYRETVQQGCAGTAQVTAEIETVTVRSAHAPFLRAPYSGRPPTKLSRSARAMSASAPENLLCR